MPTILRVGFIGISSMQVIVVNRCIYLLNVTTRLQNFGLIREDYKGVVDLIGQKLVKSRGLTKVWDDLSCPGQAPSDLI